MKNSVILGGAVRFSLNLLLLLLAISFGSFTIIDSFARQQVTRQLRFILQHQLHAQIIAPENISGAPLGQTINDTVPFDIIRTDTQNVTRYSIHGTFVVSDENVVFYLTDSLVLNYKKWNLPAGNRITYSSEGILATDFSLTSDTALIAVINSNNLVGEPVDINLRNLDIRDILGLFSRDTLVASGLLDGKIVANEFDRRLPLLTGMGSVRGFALMQQALGTLQLNAQMLDDTIRGNAALAGDGNDLNVRGQLILNKGLQQLDALLNITRLQMATLQGFMKGNLSSASGSVNGIIALGGKITHPEWKGTINIDTARFTLDKLSSSYTIEKQNIGLDYPFINFNRFTIKDSLGNPLLVTGCLGSAQPGKKYYDVQLDLSSQNFTLINAPKAINNQVYGYAGIDAAVTVTGNTTDPAISGLVQLNERTDVTIVLPEKNTDKDAANSVVRFANSKGVGADEKPPVLRQAIDTKPLTDILFKKLTVITDKRANLTIIIDPSTGDELKVNGVAQLNPGIDTGSNMAMSGTYVLDSGYYELNYQFLRKRFNVIKGSTISFDGNLADAKVNISAEYIVNTSAKDLLGNEVGSVNPRIARSFKQKIPFRVKLFLKGALQHPVISFDIRLPEAGAIGSQLRYTIENKLVQLRSDIAATNKQVFALLALDRFVGEQSTDFFKGNEANFSDINRESVSEFLSAALDQIASDLFKGINVDLNRNSFKDFTNVTGTQKTDLNVEVSKNFLNDRLSVTVGKNFGIEGQDGSTKASQQKASRFLPDVTVNYKLSADGRYMIRSYNKNQFEVILDGYVVETGLAFIITMDYDKFDELFSGKDKKQGNK